MKEFLTMDDVDFKNKTVLLRIDINSPVDKRGKIEVTERLTESAKTVKELSKKKAKVVVLAHQGRNGEPDFIPLRQHAMLLTKYVGKKVEYVDDIIGEKAKRKIKSLKMGEIILLDNVRFLEDETVNKSPKEHVKASLVQALAPLADVFVNDAFSAAHRSHASLVGFTTLLTSVAGRIMEREIKLIEGIITTMKISRHDTFVLGGAKPKEPLDIMEYMLENHTLETVLVSGIVGELFLIARGHKLGEPTMNFLDKKGYLEFLPQVKKLSKKYNKIIEIPVDVAVKVNGKRLEILVENLPINSQIMDIGSKTTENYSKIIKESVSIGMKGPAGVYEEKGFELGTKAILEAIAGSNGISLVGGGHTLSALAKLKIDKSKFSHVSLGGGALITYLSGKKMPAIEALKGTH